ncbi:MAG TPA: N,N-dimethylformamidase beta subunit family domain-containing protein [Bryobacteraceae bacterium]|nr:N,N-dimethylformamidase beta subunit family domain-containing protein [Bryobacteraceae bacterium]
MRNLTHIIVVFGLGLGAKAATPVQTENAQQGTTAWQLSNPATNREIEGYASLTSVNQGSQIGLFVNTADATFMVDIYRIGWYGGAGGREVLGPVTLPGTRQLIPVADGNGTFDCRWINPYVITVPSSWLSGVYLAKLTGSNSGKQSYIIFAVREDSRASTYLFQSSVTTYQAYNNWPGYSAGGKSLYPFNSFNDPAVKVSFNRPYALGQQAASSSGVGAGDFLTMGGPPSSSVPAGWEINMLRFLEREGYDVTYCTNIDVHENPGLLLSHKAFLSVGHDEYWSWQMRANVEAARDQGVGLGFFASNICYWEVRFEPSLATGAADRIMVGYKANYTLDPYYYDSDPTNDKYITYLWRANFGGKPSEQAMIGVEYITNPVNGDIIITAAPSHWALQGTGLVGGDHLQGLLGYEVDGMLDNDSPPDISVIAQTPLSNGGPHPFSEMTSYVAPSGATVFATGSMQWSWGLDDYNAPAIRNVLSNSAAQQITRNVLSKLITLTTGGNAQYVTTDTVTEGNWKGVYGSNGYIIASDSTNPPAYAAFTPTIATAYIWAASTNDARALLKSASPTDRIASTFYGASMLSVDINLTDGLTHQVAFYALDWDNQQRIETFSILDANTRAVRDTRTISNFASGQYLVWNLTGHVIVSVTSSAGPNAVVGGIFFQGTPGADLTIRKVHSGNFAPGEIGDTYTITVTNSGGSPTSGTVSVIDTLPSSLIPVTMSGLGWSCSQPAGPCSRSDTLNGGQAYPPIAVTITVASNASSSVTNIATVSGGGDINTSNNTASDITTILAPPLAPTAFFTGYALNAPRLRNDTTGWLGVTLTVGNANLIVDALGRICVAGNSGTHLVKFVNAATGTDVPGGGVTISMAGCIAGQFVYGYLPNAITLQKNAGYYLVTQEFSGADQWYDIGTVSAATDALVGGGVYSLDGSTWNLPPNLAANTSYVPPNFRYLKQTSSTVSVTVQTNLPGVSFIVDSATYTSAQVFAWPSGSAHTLATASPQSPGTGAQYIWTSWSDGGAQSHSVTASSNTTYTLNFKTQYLLVTSVSPAGAGTIAANAVSSTGYYDSGTSVQLTASANTGNTFVNWSGDLSGTAVQQSIVMSAPHAVTANFQSSGGGGSATAFVISKTLGRVRNDYSGWVGMMIRVGTGPVTVTALGRIVVPNNSGSHTVKIVDGASGLDVPGASTLVATAAATAGGFAFSNLAAGVTLNANGLYYVLTQEALGGDQWYDYDTTVQTTGAAAVTSAVYGSGSGYVIVGSSGHAYGPVDFQYSAAAGGGLPVITQQPQNATVTAGQTASFSVSASSSSPLSYQWQSQPAGSAAFANITVATLSTYTTASAQASDNGTQLRCVVTNSSGSVTTNVVTLNVQSVVGTPFVNSQVLGTLRNNYTGWVGMSIVVNQSPITITALGRMFAPGNIGTHTVKIVDAATGADVAGGSVAITMTGTAGGFVYANLASPIVLTANATYHVLSQEAINGDQWYDYNTSATTSWIASLAGAVYGTGAPYTTAPGSAGHMYVPVDFKYTVAPTGYVTSQTLGTVRSDFTGWVGMALTVGASPLTVGSLGRMVVAGNTGNHVVKLVSATGVDISGGLATVVTAGAKAGAFAYAALASPIVLSANTTYYVISQESTGGDSWYDWNTSLSTATVAALRGAIWSASSTYNLVGGSAGHSYVPVDFLFQ